MSILNKKKALFIIRTKDGSEIHETLILPIDYVFDAKGFLNPKDFHLFKLGELEISEAKFIKWTNDYPYPTNWDAVDKYGHDPAKLAWEKKYT